MAPHILDNSPNEKINIRSPLFKSVELSLLLIYGSFFLYLSYLYITSPKVDASVIFILLLILANFRFVYLGRSTTLAYQQTQNSDALKKLENSFFRLIFTCTSIFISFIALAVLVNMITQETTLSARTTTFSDIVSYLFLGLFLIVPLFQVYYMALTADLFRDV